MTTKRDVRLRWAAHAEADLRDIFRYLRHRNRTAAHRILDRIEETASLLMEHPLIGRTGRRAGTREKQVVGTPYALVYVVEGDIVEIARVLHGARAWPPETGD